MVGIDISDRSIKIAEVAGNRSPRLRTLCWSPLDAQVIHRGLIRDVPLAIAALREAFSKCSPIPIEGNMVVASIPETQSFVRVLDLPEMSGSELDEAVQWAVRQHIPFDLERVYLDWQLLPMFGATSGHRQVLVGAAQRDVVDPLLAVLDGLQLGVVALELEAQAVVRSLLPLAAEDVRGVLIVDLGATSTNVILFDQGAMRFTTSVPIGGDDLTQRLSQTLQLTPSMAAEKKALTGVLGGQSDQEVAAVLREVTADLVRRIEQVVREMAAQTQTRSPVAAILLSGGTANLPGLPNIFSEVFPGIPVEMGNPFTNLLGEANQAQMPLSAADAAHFVTAIGLAMRPTEGGSYAP